MDYQNLICEITDDIAVLTLNRPEKRNALSRALRDEIVACLSELETGGAARAVVITANGDSFCAGFDLSEFQSGNAEEIFSHATAYHHRVYTSPLPLIAAVNGPAMAGGMDLAAMCDIRITHQHAFFGQPQVKMGIPAAYDLMLTVLAEPVARELCLTGRKLDAGEAHRQGFVSEIVAPDELLTRAKEIARSVASSKGSDQMKQRFLQSQPRLFEI